MKSILSRQFATKEVQTQFVSRRAMKMLYADADATEVNLNMQLNSFAILPKEERARLNLYDSAPRRDSKKPSKKKLSFLKKRVVQSETETTESIVEKML